MSIRRRRTNPAGISSLLRALVEQRSGIGARLEQLKDRWRGAHRPQPSGATRSQGYVEVRRPGDDTFEAQAAHGTDTKPLLTALDTLLTELHAETSGKS